MARNKYDVDEELSEEFNWGHYKRLGQYIKPYKKRITKILAVIIFANICGMFGPYFTKVAIDDAIPNHNLNTLYLIGGLFLLSLIIVGVFMRYSIYHITELRQDVFKDMRFYI